MSDVNKWCLSGVAKKVEMRTGKNGSHYAALTLGVGGYNNAIDCYTLLFFREQARVLMDIVREGAYLLVDGKICVGRGGYPEMRTSNFLVLRSDPPRPSLEELTEGLPRRDAEPVPPPATQQDGYIEQRTEDEPLPF